MKPEDICKVDIRGQAARRHAEAHQRGAAAPGDLQAAARRQGGRPLPSAARHGLRRRPASRSPSASCRRSRSSSARCRSPITRRPAAEVRRHHPAVRQGLQHHHPGQPRHGHLRPDLEKAYWNTRDHRRLLPILILARQLGRVNYFTHRPDQGAARPEEDALGYDDLRFQGRRLRPVRQQHLRPSQMKSYTMLRRCRTVRPFAETEAPACDGRAGGWKWT